jgi:hypothetical protein
MDNSIKITAEGPTGSGKGTALTICAEALKKNGFIVPGNMIEEGEHSIRVIMARRPIQTSATFNSLVLWALWMLLRMTCGLHPGKNTLNSWRDHALKTGETPRLDPLP